MQVQGALRRLVRQADTGGSHHRPAVVLGVPHHVAVRQVLLGYVRHGPPCGGTHLVGHAPCALHHGASVVPPRLPGIHQHAVGIHTAGHNGPCRCCEAGQLLQRQDAAVRGDGQDEVLPHGRVPQQSPHAPHSDTHSGQDAPSVARLEVLGSGGDALCCGPGGRPRHRVVLAQQLRLALPHQGLHIHFVAGGEDFEQARVAAGHALCLQLLPPGQDGVQHSGLHTQGGGRRRGRQAAAATPLRCRSGGHQPRHGQVFLWVGEGAPGFAGGHTGLGRQGRHRVAQGGLRGALHQLTQGYSPRKVEPKHGRALGVTRADSLPRRPGLRARRLLRRVRGRGGRAPLLTLRRGRLSQGSPQPALGHGPQGGGQGAIP